MLQKRDGRIERIGAKEGLQASEVTTMLESLTGDTWIGTGGTLHVYSQRFAPVSNFDMPVSEFGIQHVSDTRSRLAFPMLCWIARFA
jgi:hypothetical protein